MKRNNRLAMRMSMRMTQKQTFRLVATSGAILALAILTSLYFIRTQEGMSREKTILKTKQDEDRPSGLSKIALQEDALKYGTDIHWAEKELIKK